MGLMDLIGAVRKRWLSLALVMLGVIALANLLTVLTPKTFTATSQVFVSVRDGSSTASDLVSGSTFAQGQVQSYVNVVTAPVVLQPVVETLDLDTTADGLAQRVEVSVPEGTVLMDISVSDTQPARAAEINDQVVQEFVQRVALLESPSSSQESPVKITVLKPAVAPETATSPNAMRNLLTGAALGLILGLGVALAREILDDAIRTREDIEVTTDLPLLGHIPFDSGAPDQPLVGLQEYSSRGEAFRTLRTNLQFVVATKQRHSFVLTSSLPGEGKTTTCANLGQALAAIGAKVCLVEGDLRRPKLLEYLGLEGSVGLTDLVIGKVKLDDALQTFGEHDIAVLGAGRTPPNPSELLGSGEMEMLIRELERRFDYVIVDAPPLLPVTDAAVLSRIVGGTLVAVGAEVVTRSNLAGALDTLGAVDASVLGVVLNRSHDVASASRSNYYYDERPPKAEAVPATRRERSK